MSFLGGCFLFVDVAISILFVLLFDWLGATKVGIIGGVIIGSPVIIWIIKKIIAEEKEEAQQMNARKAEKERKRRQQKEIERRNSYCAFNDGISKDDFQKMAYRAAKHIRRLEISIDGPRIEGFVESQSGISTWKFDIDFNDYGHITGNWWITYRENYDSNIPDRFAELMEAEIENAE